MVEKLWKADAIWFGFLIAYFGGNLWCPSHLVMEKLFNWQIGFKARAEGSTLLCLRPLVLINGEVRAIDPFLECQK